ncbi:flavoprotein [Saccharopolyspora rectivirgula]|uniref:flavoprotein n=1 Tax=Saccharopolyspora rectivirgula TaxID=28042 RepID=UPI0003FA7F1B|nr:flavoprotein [Saccharopolyspora rectivirgula]
MSIGVPGCRLDGTAAAAEEQVAYVVGCAAPPVRELTDPVTRLRQEGWQVHVVLTPTAASWVKAGELEKLSGNPVLVEQGAPGEVKPLPRADAVLAAPLTFNTLNKVASGISDTLAARMLNEMLCFGVPMVFAPCVNSVFRQHPVYKTNVERLASCGVEFLVPSSITTRGSDGHVAFDWEAVVSALHECHNTPAWSRFSNVD